IRRPTWATSAVAATMSSTPIGPVQPRSTNATAASANARTSFVVGFSPTYRPLGGRRTNDGGTAACAVPPEDRVSSAPPVRALRGLRFDAPLAEREAGDEARRQAGENDEHDEARDRLVD